MLKKIFLSLFAILLTLLSIALFRTFMHASVEPEFVEVKAMSIDEAKAIQNLATSISLLVLATDQRSRLSGLNPCTMNS